MAKNHVSFRLSDPALDVILSHQSYLETVSRRPIDRTDALEDILLKFGERLQGPLEAVKRVFHVGRKKIVSDPKTTSLEAFTSA